MDRLVLDFETYNRAKNLSGATISSYNRKLQDFAHWLGDDLSRASFRTVREYMADKVASGFKPQTIHSYFATLSTFYSFLVADGVIEEQSNPTRNLSAPRVPQGAIEPLTSGHIFSLLKSFNRKRRTGDRNYVICLLLLDTGLRVNEAAGLKADDIDWERQRLKIMGKGQKHRWVYMGQVAARVLRAYLETRSPDLGNADRTLFTSSGGRPLHSGAISKMVTRQLDILGIPRVGVSAHRLRHTFAVNFLRGGGGVFQLQRLLGHSSLAMTRRYVMLAEDDLAEAHRRASPVDNLGWGDPLGEAA
jgi:site-specific recombinase XerD